MASLSRRPFLEKGVLSKSLITMLVVRGAPSTRPLFCLSSGICPRPLSFLSLMEREVMSSPLKRTEPDSIFLSPVMASTSSVWPLPSTPAMPTISPLLIAREKSFTPRTPLLFLTLRSFTSSITSPGSLFSFSTTKDTGRPTIIAAISWAEVDATSTSPMNLPRLMTVHLFAVRLISSSLWVMRIMLLPSFARFFMISISSSIS